ncbi:receptor-type tyrosine-protein phosphatase epsilon-like isoform X2 [Haliotis cracherodii]|uniref:receptor-type tyrosine-protein phosphatase epsilon-like isoform X2 n=1 Tax=Haliotis cracherodii TaxID=6455 RepID=UPI0039EB2EAF
MVVEINQFNIYSTFGTMISQHFIFFLILVLVWCPQVSGEDACPCVTGSNCPENCILVNIAPQATSYLTSVNNNNYTITGQAAWVTDRVTSGSCASVSSLYPAWKAEFGQNRTVNEIKIFWEGQQDDIFVSVDDKRCHTADSNYTWMSEYNLVCDVPLTGSNLLMYRQPTGEMLNLSLCEVKIYATPTPPTSPILSTISVIASSTVSTDTPTTSTTSIVSPTVTPISTSSSKTSHAVSTPQSGASTVDTPSIASSTVSTETTTTSTTSLVFPTVPPISASSSKTPRADPTPPSGASTVSGTTIGAIVGVVVLLLIIIVLAVVCRKRIKEKYNPLDAEAKEAGKNQAIVIDKVDQPNSTVFDLNEYRSVELPADPEAEPASSTGTSKSHIPSAVSVTDLPNYISERLDSIISTEYSMMPAGLRNTHTYVTATREGNLHKNRYKNLFAYDDSLVPLQNEGGPDYINASYIHGFKSPLKFIATQGPMNSTVVDFWRMVWQEGSREIVMLTNLLEQGMHKCHMYWLAKGQRGSFGNINVTQEKAIELAHYTVRIFSLHHRKDDTRREVTQYHFTAWPDHGVPTAPSLVSFWRHVNTRSQPNDGQAGPIIVHCSAGVGRTGTYIGLDILMNEALVEEKLNFFMTVLNMRENRLNMVQTQGQYKFLHWAVLEALLCRNTPVMASELPSMLDPDNKEIQGEYKNLEVMMSLQGDQKTDGKPDLTQTGDDLFNPNTTSLPSYHNKKGFLHIGLVKEPSPEELWRVICRNNTVTIITINQTSSDATPKDVGTSLTLGEFQVTLTSAEDVSKGVTEKKLTVKTETMQPFGDSGSGVTSITMYNLDSPSTERYFDKAQLLVLIELLTERQHISGRHPVILQCRDDPRKCSLFAAAVNVVSSLRLEKEVDIYLTVREIQCRNGQPVASLEDYRYLYELASHQLQSTNPFTNN